jgi:ferrous iron transport protein B
MRERVAREILLNESPDVVLHVLDARNLERMLAMTVQLIEAGLPVILVVNILDEAERMGLQIDLQLLQQRLGIPVIGAATACKRGINEIRNAVAEFGIVPVRSFNYSRELEADIGEVAALITGENKLSPKSLALLLLQQDEEIVSMYADQQYSALQEKSKN